MKKLNCKSQLFKVMQKVEGGTGLATGVKKKEKTVCNQLEQISRGEMENYTLVKYLT